MNNQLVNYLNKNKDYINFFKSEEIDMNVVEVKIIDFTMIEFLYHQFITDIYYFLRTRTLIDTLNIEIDKIEINKKKLSIVDTTNDSIIAKVNIQLWGLTLS